MSVTTKNILLTEHPGTNGISWTTVEVTDRYAGQWQWGKGPYYDWCDENCTNGYNIVKYTKSTICARFKSPEDAALFALRWS